MVRHSSPQDSRLVSERAIERVNPFCSPHKSDKRKGGGQAGHEEKEGPMRAKM